MSSDATPQVENPYAGQGAVLLDIGGDVGALVVTMPASMVGVEVEIRPLGRGTQRIPHGDGHHARPSTTRVTATDHRGTWPIVAVVERPVAGVEAPGSHHVAGRLTAGADDDAGR